MDLACKRHHRAKSQYWDTARTLINLISLKLLEIFHMHPALQPFPGLCAFNTLLLSLCTSSTPTFYLINHELLTFAFKSLLLLALMDQQNVAHILNSQTSIFTIQVPDSGQAASALRSLPHISLCIDSSLCASSGFNGLTCCVCLVMW